MPTDKNYLRKGSYNVICDTCGQKYKSEDTRMQWDNTRACSNCYDPKHPWLIPLPAVIDALPVPNARPRPNPLYEPDYWYTNTIIGVVYYNDVDESMGNPLIEQWNEYIGGGDSLPYTATNFPLR